MAKKYEKIDFGTGDNTPTGDTINAGFKKINTALNDIENDIESVESDLTSKINDVDSTIDGRISTQISELVDGAPTTFDTLKEIADWIENDGVDVVDLTASIANKADKSQLVGLATETYVDNAIDSIPEVDLTGLATETYVNNAIDNIDIPDVDLTDYYNISQVDALINVAQSPIVLNEHLTLTMTNGAHIQEGNPNTRTNNVELIPYARPNWQNGAMGSYSVAIGSNATAGNRSVGIGSGTRTNGNDSIGIGYNSRSVDAIAIGANATAYWKSIVIGTNVEQSSLINNTITLTNNLLITGEKSINIGFDSTYNDAIAGVAIGVGVVNQTANGVKLGSFNIKEPSIFAIGDGTSNTTRSNAFKIDVEKKATFYNIASYDQPYAFTSDNELVTKKYVDDAVANVGGGGTIDLSNYYTSSQVDSLMGNYMTYYDVQSQFDLLLNGGSQSGLLTMKEFDGLKADGQPIKVLGLAGEYGYQNYYPGSGNIPREGLYIVNGGYDESFMKGGSGMENWIVGYNKNNGMYEPGFYTMDDNYNWVHKYVTRFDLEQLQSQFDSNSQNTKDIIKNNQLYERAYRTKSPSTPTNTNTEGYLYEGVYQITDANGYINTPNPSNDFDGTSFSYSNFFEIETALTVNLQNRLQPGAIINVDIQDNNQVWHNISNITISQTMSRFYEDFKTKISNKFFNNINTYNVVVKSEDLTIESFTNTLRVPTKKWLDNTKHFRNGDFTNYKIRIRLSGELVNASQSLPTVAISAGFVIVCK